MDSPPRCVVPATPESADRMAAELLPEHAREVLAIGGLDGAEALRLSLAASLEAYAYVPAGGEAPVFIMGVGHKSLLSGEATVWMLGTARQAAHPAGVLRTARWGVERAFAATGAERLEQLIPDWYETGLRFVRRLGFALNQSGLRSRDGAVLWRAVRNRCGIPAVSILS